MSKTEQILPIPTSKLRASLEELDQIEAELAPRMSDEERTIRIKLRLARIERNKWDLRVGELLDELDNLD